MWQCLLLPLNSSANAGDRIIETVPHLPKLSKIDNCLTFYGTLHRFTETAGTMHDKFSVRHVPDTSSNAFIGINI